MTETNQIINDIIDWNDKRNNINYDPSLEFEMLQEEVLEYAHSYIKTVNEYMGIDVQNHKVDTEEESEELNLKISAYVNTLDFLDEWRVHQADALADIIFVAVGSLFKLTGSKEKVNSILQAVINANEKKGKDVDDNGKIIKPEDFVPPEDVIRLILKGA